MGLQLIVYYSYDARKRSVDYTSFLAKETEQLVFGHEYLFLMKQKRVNIKRCRLI